MNSESVFFENIKYRLAKSIRDTLLLESQTPEEETPVDVDVRVPAQQIKQLDDENDTAQALVVYVVKCPKEKTHAVRIQFKFDCFGRFLRDTMTYV
jgi:hypothetical protein